MISNKKKLLALDLDGTTLNDSHAISMGNVAVIRELRAQDCIVCFVTGRRGVDMDILGEDAYIADYSILNTGAQILDVATHRPVWERLVAREVATDVISHCLEHRYLLNVCGPDYWGVNYINDRVEEYARRIRRQPAVFSSPLETPLDHIEGFTATEHGEETVAYIRSCGMDLYCVMSEPGAYDITPGGISKWTSLLWLARRLDIPVENIVAAGNYLNDVEMIREAGIGVAVQNALPEVKAAADYVTKRTNNEDVVVEIAQQFLLV